MLVKRSAYPHRKVAYFIIRVRATDPPWRCLGCKRTRRAGEPAISRRSAHETTQGVYGPIEDIICWTCYWLLPDTIRPELGKKAVRWERYDGLYPWSQW